VLRRRLATLDQLWEALRVTRSRLGNPARRDLLLDSRDRPWSQAERVAHRVLRLGGLTGWVTNLGVNLSGRRAYIDVAFEEFRVAIEVDGYRFHGLQGGDLANPEADPDNDADADDAEVESREVFEGDRWKGCELTADGWLVLRVTWRQLTQHSDWVLRVVKATLALRGWTSRAPHTRRLGVQRTDAA